MLAYGVSSMHDEPVYSNFLKYYFRAKSACVQVIITQFNI
jgi:hypothetical protein